MNLNVESHFSKLPSANVPRTIFDRSHSHITSLNAGQLIPFYVDEVLPGDSFSVTSSKVIRSQTMLTPILDSLFCDTFYFFVPNRLTWSHWKEFCGENAAGAWAPDVSYKIPTIGSPSGGFASGTLADYFGLPVGVEWDSTDALAPSALPFRAYGLIYNHFFRDENLADPLVVPLDDANVIGTNGAGLSGPAFGGQPAIAARFHDYFSSALPEAQRGSPVGIPISVPGFNGGTFPVSTVASKPSTDVFKPFYPMVAYQYQASGATQPSDQLVQNGVVSIFGEASTGITLNPADAAAYAFAPANLVTVIPPQENMDTDELTFTINQFRLAYVMQAYLERIARTGSRYTEILSGLFAVTPSDASLQDPEYLGGNRIRINVTETTNTAQTATDYLGDVGAKSVTSDISHGFTKSFTEHGYVIGLMCIRYKNSFSQGIERFWTRHHFEDFYNPMFANLGEVPIYKAEIYATSETINDPDNIFGYQEYAADYRYKNSLVTGEMRPGVNNSLSYWHLGDYYTEEPTLSADWINVDKSMVDRVLAVSSSVANQFWANIHISCKCTRPMPMYSIPGLEPRF